MNIKFDNLFTEIHQHISKKAMVFYGPNIGKIDDCIKSVITSKKKEHNKIKMNSPTYGDNKTINFTIFI